MGEGDVRESGSISLSGQVGEQVSVYPTNDDRCRHRQVPIKKKWSDYSPKKWHSKTLRLSARDSTEHRSSQFLNLLSRNRCWSGRNVQSSMRNR